MNWETVIAGFAAATDLTVLNREVADWVPYVDM